MKLSPLAAAAANTLLRTISSTNIALYRATGGLVGGHWFGGIEILLLTTVGRRSGLARTVALLFVRDGDRLIVVASKAGMEKNPLWYENLLAHPDASVRVGRETRAVRARTASAEERARYWPRLVDVYPDYARYQARTEREIPVVVLGPR